MGLFFRATAEDLKHPTDFVVAANDGVEFAVEHELVQVARVFGEGLVGVFLAGRGGGFALTEQLDRLAQPLFE